ncbi:MAG TPA: pirin family protein [Burkholderiales bacterium]|nr:pirin family protein [Burkholderiales bacterium]
MSIRSLQQVLKSTATSDGAGVKLRRSIGQARGAYHDPFLMLDEFSSENPGDYIAGFPSHPHRGFETVTYLLDGHMLHEDHLGNRGDLKSGGVQWMTAGRGIIHSEMPQQEEGRMRGFQLWINLPANEKMKPAGYRDIQPSEIPVVALPGGGRAKVIAGTLDIDGTQTRGAVERSSADVLYLDIALVAGERHSQAVTAGHNAFIYPYEGELTVGAADNARKLETRSAGLLSEGDRIEITAGAHGARFLLLAGRPLREPIVQYGPFVMNTREEIEQALNDYQSGTLAEPAR